MACQLCTSYVNPDGLSDFVACRLIALDKCPGVRPIGIGEACRCIIAKTILNVIGPDVMEAAGPLQLCAGQDAGCEAVVHSIRQLYLEYDTEALLLVDAENAFNSLNRETALRNILHLCPSIGHVVFNIYHDNVSLFIGGETIYSLEGITQGDPLAMAMYALDVTPLIQQMGHINSTRQAWYVNDSTACGSVEGLLSWWNALIDIGPQFGYYPNCFKSSWLLVKTKHHDHAQQLFHGTDISITPKGHCVLGSPICTTDFVTEWVTDKVQFCVDELILLLDIAKSHPQAAYSVLSMVC